MNFFYSFTIAFTSLRARKGRTFLTMLGILIGIASVILVMAVGAGAESLIVNEIKKVGSNLIAVIPGGQAGENGPPAAMTGVVITTLKYEDALALKDRANFPYIVDVTAYVKGPATIVYGNKNTDSFFNGVMSGYPNVEDVQVETGRFFSEEEERTMAKVTVIGSAVKKELFDGEDPISKNIRIGKESFRVIGALKERGSAGFQNKDDQVFIPLNTAQKIMLGIHHIGLLRVKVDKDIHIDQTITQMRELIRKRHKITDPTDDDFSVMSQKTALNTLGQITGILTFFMAAVAAISLLVGGVGIMNIMLVNIKERTREIGLRKAIGAKPKNILRQFLVEAVTITILGGICGIVLGSSLAAIIAFIMTQLGYNWDLSISLQSILMGITVASVVGIIFGYYPAKKAAKMNAIEALRYE